MKSIIDLIFTLSVLLGGATLSKNIFEEVRDHSLKKISSGLSSHEKFSNALTGKRLPY